MACAPYATVAVKSRGVDSGRVLRASTVVVEMPGFTFSTDPLPSPHHKCSRRPGGLG